MGHRTYADAYVVRVDQPLSSRRFILVIPAFSIPAFSNTRYTGHFTLHALSALVSFGSVDLNSHFHEEQTRSSQAVRTDGREFSLLFWLNVENLEFRTPRKGKFAVRK